MRVKYTCMRIGEILFGIAFTLLCIFLVAVWLLLQMDGGFYAADMMQLAPLLLVTYSWHFVVHAIASRFRTQACMRQILAIPTYYGPMYVVFFMLLMQYTREFITTHVWHYSWDGCAESGAVSFLKIWNATDESIPDLDNCNLSCESELADDHSRLKWCYHISKDTTMPQWLRVLPLFTPIFAWMSFLVGVVQMWKHSRQLWLYPSNSDAWKKHDTVVLITTLPTVYALLSFKALLRSFEVVFSRFDVNQLRNDHRFGSLEEKYAFLSTSQWKFYNADFAVADLYEAWALLRFGRLKFERIKEEHNATRKAWKGFARSNTKLKIFEQGEQIYEPMAKSTEAILMVCIYCFIISTLLDSFYAITDLVLYVYVNDVYEDMQTMLNKAHYFMLGVGFVTSTMAIYAIIQIEVSFHKELEGFYPWWKFLSCKILVSLAFLQEGICLLPMPGVGVMNDTMANMFYAACLCYESFVVSMICTQAWPSNEDWYTDADDLKLSKDTKFEALLDKYQVENAEGEIDGVERRQVAKCNGVYEYTDHYRNKAKYKNQNGAIIFWKDNKWMMNWRDATDTFLFSCENGEKLPPAGTWSFSGNPENAGCTVTKDFDYRESGTDRGFGVVGSIRQGFESIQSHWRPEK